ncbi:hypothetical protein MSSAC_1995 [Methanosarcina siciliae C2J]|uniref:Uncharacterized protein n=1 Tax=Methanosarcina siciliae C2J TaxID=1434118 RepID=A0A0E3PNN7_9EURY|nr:hypothetical protein [Methanosarcina siciliae]AKB36585.1 hypothetical protein MSSAC_1995 [Methanosarcina siciliae C2J]
MYAEEWQKIKTKVPLDLWRKVEVLGFDSSDKAVINALEKLVADPELNIYGKEQKIRIQELKNELENEQRHNKESQSKIQESQSKIQESQSKILELETLLVDEKRYNQESQSKILELETLLENEQRHNQELQRELEIRLEESLKQAKDLQKELEKAERRELYFEEMHNNYMMQMQTLINQKQIAAPGAKKPWWRFW